MRISDWISSFCSSDLHDVPEVLLPLAIIAGVLEPLRKLVGEKRLRRVRLEDAMQSLLRGGRAVLDLGQRRQPCRRYAGGTRRFLELPREDLEGCAYLLFAV